MFSRIVKSARSFVSPTPLSQPETAPSTAWKPITIPATPASSKKTRSPKTSTEESTPRPKSSQSVSSKKSSASKPKQPLITVSNPTPRPTRGHSPEMVTTRQQTDAGAEELVDENSINVHVSSTKNSNKKRVIGSLDEAVAEETPSRDVKKRKVAALPVRAKALSEDEEDEGSLSEEHVKTNTRPVVEIRVNKTTNRESKKTHKKFGSDDEAEPEPEIFSTAHESQGLEDEESSDDDDAPEEVGAQTAAQVAKQKAQSAQAAIHGQKQARRERASKAQAQSKKPLVEPTLDEPEVDDLDVPTSEDEEEEDREESDSGDESIEDEEPSLDIPTSSRIRYDSLIERGPKDRSVGLTTYKVPKIQSKQLAPTASKNARNVKDVFLYGRGPRAGANRGQVKKTFV